MDDAERLALASAALHDGRFAAAAEQFAALIDAAPAVAVSALHGLALAAHHLGRFAEALWCYQQLWLRAAADEQQPLLHQLAIAARNAGELEAAQRYLEQELALLADNHSALRSANRYECAVVAMQLGDYPAAEVMLKQAWQHGVAAGELALQAQAICGLGELAARQGDKAAARQCFIVSQKIFLRAGALERVLELTRRLGVLAMRD